MAIMDGIEGVYQNLKGDLLESDIAQTLMKRRPIPDFPFMMVYFAVVKDLIDLFEFTIVAVFFTEFLSFLLAIVIWIWIWGKISGNWWKKYFWWYICMVIAEMIPFVGILPFNTLYVLYVHYTEKEEAIALNKLADFIEKQQQAANDNYAADEEMAA